MPLSGPILCISDHPDRKLIMALGGAGGSEVVESRLDDAASTIERIEPSAILFADPDMAPVQSLADSLTDAIDALPAPFVPVVARVNECGVTILDVLPIRAGAPLDQLVARLRMLLRVRSLHATVLRRIDTLQNNRVTVPLLPECDPLDEATVLVLGRGRTYPSLTLVVGERVGLIGAMSVETAARYLNNRDVDGILIGDGFGPSTIAAFLTALTEDSRFRDLPIGIVPDVPAGIERTRLCGLEQVRGEPEDILSHLLPLVRVHAFAARLRRHITALDGRGQIDPQTSLYTATAFDRDLPKAVADAQERGIPLSIARFGLPADLSERGRLNAARLMSRLIRTTDFACQTRDGSIVVVFAESALRHAHVIARRIASVMRHTMLEQEHENDGRVEAMVTLASLKSNDTPHSLLERISGPVMAAAAE